MFKEEAQIIPSNEKGAPEAAENTKMYSYNLLPFNFPGSEITIRFTTDEEKGNHRFSLNALPEESHKQFVVDGVPAEYVYAHFDDISAGIPVKTDLSKHPSIARAWYMHALNGAMRHHADVMVPNFLHDTECWFEVKDPAKEKYRIFKRFSLRVQFHPSERTPELLISFDGFTYVSRTSLRGLFGMQGYHRNILRRVIFRGGCYRTDQLPEQARYHPEEVFPLLNRELKSLLNISIPAVPNREKHHQFQKEVRWFYYEFATKEGFRDAIPHQNRFREVDAKDMFVLPSGDDLLEFGEGKTGRDIYQGFRDYGPVQLPPYSDAGYFYIYARHQSHVKDTLDAALHSANGENKITSFSRVPLIHEQTLDIVFDADEEPLQSILNRIRLMETDPGKCYYAFFINPWSKYEQDRNKHDIYFHVKESLLLRDIMMQNMDAAKIATPGLRFFMPNLAAAFTGKLGGIPWRLKRPYCRELIVGFGVYRSSKYNMRYTGSSVCFSGDGTFEAFDCFRENDTYALAATVEQALYKYVEMHDRPERLVIHFYRKLSRKALQPVEQMLRKLKLEIPVIIVSINKTYSKNLSAFMHHDPYGLPPAGTVINYSRHQYLLYLNDRMPENKSYSGAMPMPLKLSLWSEKSESIDDRETAAMLIQQVYDFCFLYYRSVKHARVPVTVLYPEMLAGILPHFKDQVLQTERGGRMMFL